MSNSYVEKLFNLNGKTVAITGATGQLGYELVRAFSEAGAYVFAWDKEIRSNKKIEANNIEYTDLDITDKEAVTLGIENALQSRNTLDILINNAGVSCFEHFSERPEESFDWVMDTNLKGTFFCIQSYANALKNNKLSGAVVNIGSLYGVVSPDFRIYTDCERKNSEVYGATKAGIIQMSRYFAVHLAEQNIRVNALSPGGIFNPDNPQGEDFVKNYSARCPMGRMAKVQEMVGAALYLSSDAASYVTGQNLVVDGGFSCW